MEYLRIMLSITLFVCGCYFSYDLFSNGFHWLLLLLVPLCFYAAYRIWPDNVDDSPWLEVVGDIIEWPIRAMIAVARMLVGVIRLIGD